MNSSLFGSIFLSPEITYSEFLSSDVITLATKHSKRTFKIHKALLEAKSRGLFSRLENFKEGAENIYRFHDTTENTIVRFIEWAYRDDYPETVRNVSSASASVVQPPSADEGTTDGDGPLSCHMQMYIFAHVYGISRLESMAYDRITNSLKYIGKPTDEKTKQEVISKFLFVDGVHIGKSARKQIRRHVMNGKNAGKKVHRRLRLDLIRPTPYYHKREISQQCEHQIVEKQVIRIDQSLACPVMNHRNLGTPFLTLSYPVETTSYTINVFNEFFSHVVNKFYPCRLGISPDDAKYWWLRFVLSDEAGQFSLLSQRISVQPLFKRHGRQLTKSPLSSAANIDLGRREASGQRCPV
ncbi:hypothetical protein TCE0_060f19039 [Talaromyces pinophilus]|uniref:BTB domain-containing protein n=1 Tax=Talaromyces pinophilus TaxID=128442 RepID=A0A6V8HQ99_TALPI|nr:hypothetical protein TCE0_060f19039 [Talaromyces pinophilus]